MACPTGKQRYRDRLEARLALLRCTTDTDPRRREQRAYRCPQCQGWHLTSQPRHRRKSHR